MTIFRTASYTIRPDAMEACKKVISETVAYTKEYEPGTLMYMVLQDAENPTNFVHISAYSDEAALERHITGEPMLTNIQQVIIPATVGETVFTHYTVVDAKVSSSLVQMD
jgi:quinol monooxygenase YgiN